MKKDASKNKKARVENYDEVKDKGKRLEALFNLSNSIMESEKRIPLSFNDFLYLASTEPDIIFRDIFQLFYDMVYHYVPRGYDEYDINEHTIGFFNYDFSNLFINDCDDPFLADRIFANRFIEFVNRFKKGIQSNHIYLFEGPPGSGKSTFLNNLLYKFEEYTKKPSGAVYKTFWRLDLQKLGDLPTSILPEDTTYVSRNDKYLEISCPNNDHPILQIPKKYRRQFLDELITDKDFKEKLFNDKEYAWVFKESPCCICSSIYNVLIQKLDDPLKVYNMIHAKRFDFSRQFGKGISVFNPGDQIVSKPMSDFSLQNKINDLFKNDEVKYIYSHLANTNNGVFSLMDIKEQNIVRLMNLHGIISDGVHKVELIDERIKSIFLGLINPEDKIHYENVKSFQDRIITVKIPYILDYNTEVSIYKNKFGDNIESMFLPRILSNFAKIIISSRLNTDSTAIKKWIDKPDKYKKFSDKHFLLLRMDIYTGKISRWLSEDDVRKFDYATRKSVIDESETEGFKGFSGRQSLNLFNSFISKYYKDGKPITMDMIKRFFAEDIDEKASFIPDGFVQSIEDMYDWNILQEIKESIYYYNEDQISKDIQNYLYAVNFELGSTERCIYTGDTININEDYFKNFEAIFLGTVSSIKERLTFRREIIKEYVSKTISQEMRIEGRAITETNLYLSLFEKYTKNLKENALIPYVDNETFRRALIDYNSKSFKSYDERTQKDVKFLINNLKSKFKYTDAGAQQVCLYVLDFNIAKKFN